jgi:hypothetical protein
VNRIEPIGADRVRVSPVERVSRRPGDEEPRDPKKPKLPTRKPRAVADDSNGQAHGHDHVDVVV